MADKMSQKEQQEQLIKILKKWQDVEDSSVEMAENLSKKTKNPMIQLVLEILRNDSITHKKIQQFIIDSYTKQSVQLSPEEVEAIWDSIEKHDEVEHKAIAMAEEALKNTSGFVQTTLLNYLLEDEKKHDRLLGHLETVKKGMYPYGS